MNSPPKQETSVIEPPTETKPASATAERALHQRIRQQEILSELGVAALQGAPFAELLSLAALLTAEGLETQFCKILQYQPAENRLLVVAGVGWNEGVVGVASVGADLESPAGFALHTGKPVISNHLENEDRFRTSELLHEHGIHRAMNVILQGDGAPFGVLEVDSRSEGEFGERDIAFLQGAANILGMAIERQRHERHLTAALNRHQTLLKEINHRAKNSLQLVSSMLQMQARMIDEPIVRQYLVQASHRVAAVGRLYDRLSHEADIETIDLGAYVREICKDLAESGSLRKIQVKTAANILFPPDRAVHFGLIINEIVTNACKYAYDDKAAGHVFVQLDCDTGMLRLSIRDEGRGLPPGFDISTSKGMGMRLVTTLARQLGATMETRDCNPGTEFLILVPK